MYKNYIQTMTEKHWEENKKRSQMNKKNNNTIKYVKIGDIKFRADLPLKQCKVPNNPYWEGIDDNVIKTRCLHVAERFTLYDRVIKRNSIIYVDYNNELVVCDYFPSNYQGDAPKLVVYRYDKDMLGWHRCNEDSYATRRMYKAWVYGGKKSTTNYNIKEQVENGDATFTPITRKKAKNGTRIFNEHKVLTQYETIGLRGQKVTPERYWSRMGV